MQDLSAYHDLIARKAVAFEPRGMTKIPALNGALKPHQAHTVEFCLRTGCSANFADTGLGKSFVALEWGRCVVEHENKPVLKLAPLAVGPQHQREAERWGIDAVYRREPDPADRARIVITNYERLDRFDLAEYAGLILDEASILKSYTGVTTRKLIDAARKLRWRHSATATPAPNDHMELGQQSEFLGAMPSNEMLTRWFISDQRQMGAYRLKRAAVRPFWEWVSSWARCVSKPSDLGFSDEGYVLPELTVSRHVVATDPTIETGEERNGQARLFRLPEMSATSIHREKRISIKERARLVADIVFGDWECPGNQSTPSDDARDINRVQTSASDEKDKVARQKKTKNTCTNTTAPTNQSLFELPSSKSDTTPPAVSDTLPTLNSATRSNNKLGTVAPFESAMAGCALPSASPSKTTSRCSSSKTESAPSAGPNVETQEDIDCTSIIVTQPVSSEACSAQPVTKASANIEMTPTASGAPPNTSSGRDWWVIWCETDYEQDELEHLFGDAAISIRGSQGLITKETLHEAWFRGEKKALICKPSMFGHGCNWQHCCKMAFVGLSFSYENYYQAIRRCWRYGQTRPVSVHIVGADTEAAIWRAVQRKAGDHEAMKREMTAAMARAARSASILHDYSPLIEAGLPAWMVPA